MWLCLERGHLKRQLRLKYSQMWDSVLVSFLVIEANTQLSQLKAKEASFAHGFSPYHGSKAETSWQHSVVEQGQVCGSQETAGRVQSRRGEGQDRPKDCASKTHPNTATRILRYPRRYPKAIQAETPPYQTQNLTQYDCSLIKGRRDTRDVHAEKRLLEEQHENAFCHPK